MRCDGVEMAGRLSCLSMEDGALYMRVYMNTHRACTVHKRGKATGAVAEAEAALLKPRLTCRHVQYTVGASLGVTRLAGGYRPGHHARYTLRRR